MKTIYVVLFGFLLYGCSGDNEDPNYAKIDSANFRSDFLEGEMFFDLKESIERSEGLADAQSLEFMSADGALLKSNCKN